MHKTANILNKLPKSQQPRAKRMLQDIWMAETRKDAEAAFDAFDETYAVKYEKTAECLKKDRDPLLAFSDFPAEHWKHLRTSNPIESTFATVRHRTIRSKGSDKTEIIRLVEQSPWPARRTLEKLGIPRSSFYRWYDRHRRGGPEALADRPSRPDRVWNRIPEAIRSQIVDLALDQPELSPRELAVRFTDEAEYFVSEASVYRLLKAHDLIAGPAYIVIKAAEEFRDKTTAPNQLWQTDFSVPQQAA